MKIRYLSLLLLSCFKLNAQVSQHILDTSFGHTGMVITTFPNFMPADWYDAAVVQPDQKVVAIGVAIGALRVSRYLENGQLDPSFILNGFSANLELANQRANAVALQTDGKIVLSGSSGGDLGQPSHPMIMRLHVDGSRDSSFHQNGMVTYPEPGSSTCMAIQTDGKILIAGYKQRLILARYTSAGDADTAFSTAVNALQADSGLFARAISMMPDGRIVVVGDHGYGTAQVQSFILRFQPNGAPDTTLNHTGRRFYSLTPSTYTRAVGMALQPDGKVVINSVNGNLVLSRYNLNGDPDSTFNHTGNFTYNGAEGYSCYLQPDGKIVVGGASNNHFFLIRVYGNGQIDPTFGQAGTLNTSIEGPDRIHGITPYSDGKIAAVGSANSKLCATRYLRNNATSIAATPDLDVTLHVYPNPASGTLQFSNNTGAQVQAVQLIAVDGRIVMTDNSGRDHQQYSLSGIASGIYYLRCQLKNTPPITKAIVIQP